MRSRKIRYQLFLYLLIFLSSVVLGKTFVQAKTVKLNQTSLLLEVGNTYDLDIKGVEKISWSSNNKSIAAVDQNGIVTGKKAGVTKILGKVNGKTYRCYIQVYKVNTGDKKVDKAVTRVIKSEINAKMSTFERVKAIHDWIVLNCSYDYDNYLRNTIPQDSYSIRGLMLKKTGVCAGYAETFQTFMKSLGIGCKLVEGYGNGQSHAWNMVKVSGKWSFIDVTWDDPVPDQKDHVSYKYFLLSDSEMNEDHVCTTKNLPACTTKQETYLKQLVTVCDSIEMLESILSEHFDRGEFKVKTYMTESLLEKSLEEFQAPNYFPNKYNQSFRRYEVEYSEYCANILEVEYRFIS